LSFDNQYHLTHWKLGDVYYAAGDKEQALTAWQHCAVSEPNYIPALFNAGIVCRELNRPEEALSYFQKVVAINSDDADAWVEIAELQTDAGLLAEADAALLTAFRLAPDSPDAHYAAARLHSARKQFKPALNSLQTAISKGYNNKERMESDPLMAPLRKDKEVSNAG
jgi:tetratricopeptide (TPR) repeat protein